MLIILFCALILSRVTFSYFYQRSKSSGSKNDLLVSFPLAGLQALHRVLSLWLPKCSRCPQSYYLGSFSARQGMVFRNPSQLEQHFLCCFCGNLEQITQVRDLGSILYLSFADPNSTPHAQAVLQEDVRGWVPGD